LIGPLNNGIGQLARVALHGLDKVNLGGSTPAKGLETVVVDLRASVDFLTDASLVVALVVTKGPHKVRRSDIGGSCKVAQHPNCQ
jgi:hypothetical protein